MRERLSPSTHHLNEVVREFFRELQSVDAVLICKGTRQEMNTVVLLGTAPFRTSIQYRRNVAAGGSVWVSWR